jgi:hypothetical protein
VADAQLFWLASAEAPYRNPAWYLERLDPSMYLTREYAPLPKRLEGFLGYARAVPALTASIRANLRTPLPKAFIERGVAGFGGYATFFRNEMPGYFAQLADEKLKRELGEATAAAAAAMDELTTWLESQRATATADFALGAPKFLEMLRETERVDIPLEELEAGGAQGSRAQSCGAQGCLRGLRTQSQPHGLRWKDARQQAFGRLRRGRLARSSRSCGSSSSKRRS